MEISSLFDGASKADDSRLAKIWAGLLAEAMTAGERDPQLRTYTAVIAQFSASDAVLFDYLVLVEKELWRDYKSEYRIAQAGPYYQRNAEYLMEVAAQRRVNEPSSFEGSSLNLLRLGLADGQRAAPPTMTGFSAEDNTEFESYLYRIQDYLTQMPGSPDAVDFPLFQFVDGLFHRKIWLSAFGSQLAAGCNAGQR